jgi:pimeloyl-ACP methyl ester carboxylesterase
MSLATGTCRLPDGRALSFSELGDTNGAPVFWCHGGLSSRLDAQNAADAAAATGVRLIAADRPGIAGSTRRKHHRVADGAGDLAALADHLGIERFSVLGWSAGGPYALACAALLGDRVRAVATIGSMAPIRGRADVKELGLRVDRLFVPLSRRAPWLAALLFRVGARQKPEKQKDDVIRGLSNADGRVLAKLPSSRLSDPYRAAMVHGPHGLVDDYRAVGRSWVFDLAAVQRPVRLWQGAADDAIPVSIGRRLADSIPGSTLELVPDAGHFLVLEHGKHVLEQLLADGA